MAFTAWDEMLMGNRNWESAVCAVWRQLSKRYGRVERVELAQPGRTNDC